MSLKNGKYGYKTPNIALYNIPFNIEMFNGMLYQTFGASGLRVPNVGLDTGRSDILKLVMVPE